MRTGGWRRLAAKGFTEVIVFNLGPAETLSVLATLTNRSVPSSAPAPVA
jgi:hypothetical protein